MQHRHRSLEVFRSFWSEKTSGKQPLSLPDGNGTVGTDKTPATGFTLVELLVVISVIVVMMVLAIPAFNALKGEGDQGQELTDMCQYLEQARAYAMANNTYVFVGINEVYANQSDTAIPQTSPPAGQTGGRIVMMAVASRDGTSIYNRYQTNAVGTNWRAAFTAPAYYAGRLYAVTAGPKRFDNLALAESLVPPTSGPMARNSISNVDYRLGEPESASTTPFNWPLNTAAGTGPKTQYVFSKVIEFDPQGEARINTAQNTDYAASNWLEIGMYGTRGTFLLATPTSGANYGNQAAIQMDCMTGETHLYRP